MLYSLLNYTRQWDLTVNTVKKNKVMFFRMVEKKTKSGPIMAES